MQFMRWLVDEGDLAVLFDHVDVYVDSSNFTDFTLRYVRKFYLTGFFFL